MGSVQSLTGFPQTNQADKMSGYYRLHAKIYDLTRWTFLFGRKWLLDWLPFGCASKVNIAEIGCGTGYNLKALSDRFPKARLVGIDISSEMLDIADKKTFNLDNHVILKQKNYGSESVYFLHTPDCILMSYCLTMVNPDWEKLILQTKQDLGKDGVIAVVDFHLSKKKWFQRWMQFNHVQMEGQILPFLQTHFKTVKLERRRAYLGLWEYFLFIGKI